MDFADRVGQLSEQEIKRLRVLLDGYTQATPKELPWEEPRPLPAEIHEQLKPVPRPEVPERPTADDIKIHEWCVEAWAKKDKARFQLLTQIPRPGDGPDRRDVPNLVYLQRRSQYQSDLAYADPSEPLWCVRVQHSGTAPDAGLPPLAIRAMTAQEAEKRYARLCGDLVLLNDGKGAQSFVTERYVEQLAPVPTAGRALLPGEACEASVS
jgi:hypothetical protein